MVRRAVVLISAAALLMGMASAPAGAHQAVDQPAATAVAAPPARPDGVPGRGRYTFLLKLNTASTLQVFRSTRAGRQAKAQAARAQLTRVRQAQNRVIGDLPGRTPVLYRTQALLAGVAVTTNVANYDALTQLPGVTAVYPVAPKTVATAPAKAGQAATTTSSAVVVPANPPVTIGMIDTGIDYTSADFGGKGTVAAYQAALSADTTTPQYPVGGKIVGGMDLVGDAYDATSNFTPQPDPNPLDCYHSDGELHGHGTYTAGIAAGQGVTANGKPYVGPYGASQPQTLSVPPGTNPYASLYSFKVFGCAGFTNVIAEAIDDAVALDTDADTSNDIKVLNISAGSPFGSPDDGDSIAIQAAVAAGIVVVTAAGNGGDEVDAGSAPGTVPSALTVAGGSAAGIYYGTARGLHAAGNLKPDVAANGTDVISANAGSSPPATQPASGTSAAAPAVAGLAAAIASEHPDWSPAQIKADIMNTADIPVVDGKGRRYAPNRVGSGAIDPAFAMANSVLFYDSSSPAATSVSFGPVAVTDQMSLTEQVTVANTNASDPTSTQYPLEYSASYLPIDSMPGVDITVSSDPVSLLPGESQQLTVTVKLNPSQMAKSVDPTEAPAAAAQTMSDASGLLTLTPQFGASQGQALHLPVYIAPRPASTMAQPPSVALAGGTQQGTLQLTGAPVDVPGVQSLVGGFELLASSDQVSQCGQDPDGTFDLNAYNCYRTNDDRAADIRYVGVTSDGADAYFAINTWYPWRTPGQVTFNIYFYANGADSPTYYLTNERVGSTDSFVAQLHKYSSTKPVGPALPLDGVSGDTDTAIFDSDSMVLPVSLSTLSSLGLTSVNLALVAYSSYAPFNAPVDMVGWTGAGAPALSANLSNPAITVIGTSHDGWPVDDPADKLTVTRNLTSYAEDRGSYVAGTSQGLLLLHLHNEDGNKAQLVSLPAGVGISVTSIRPQFGQPVTVTATLAAPQGGPQPSGTLTLTAAGQVLGTRRVSAAGAYRFTFTPTSVGALALAVRYDPGASSFSATSSAQQSVNVQKLATTVNASVTPTTVKAGGRVVIQTTVSGAVGSTRPTGWIQLRNGRGQALIPQRPLPTSGTWTFNYRPTAPGQVYVHVNYFGDKKFAASQSAARHVTVQKNSAKVTMNIAPRPGRTERPATATVHVAGVSGVVPTGTVTVRRITGPHRGIAAQGVLRSGVATLRFRTNVTGLYQYRAFYTGNANYGRGQTRVQWYRTSP